MTSSGFTACSGVSPSTTRVTLPFSNDSTARTSHCDSRAKPCAGSSSRAPGPNHGQQTGTPPRIGLPASNQEEPLIHSTGRSPAGV